MAAAAAGTAIDQFLEPAKRLSTDLAKAAETMTDAEARYLVDIFYSMQANRIAATNQVRALSKTKEPHEVLKWFAAQAETLENQVQRALDKWTDKNPVGKWMKSVDGVGPVLSAGLLGHLKIEQPRKDAEGEVLKDAEGNILYERTQTAGAFWAFAGLDPGQEWKEGEKRPYNATLKTLCWKLGECFVRVSGKPTSLYGRLYAERKQQEVERNAAGEFSAQAARALQTKRIGEDKDAYLWYSAKFDPRIVQAYLKHGVPFSIGMVRGIPTVPELRQYLGASKDKKKFERKFSKHLEAAELHDYKLKSMDQEGWKPTGMLPPAHVHARAKRFAVKIFLSHLHDFWYEVRFGEKPPKPYAIAILGHAHMIERP